jgi:hypothetical protein
LTRHSKARCKAGQASRPILYVVEASVPNVAEAIRFEGRAMLMKEKRSEPRPNRLISVFTSYRY